MSAIDKLKGLSHEAERLDTIARKLQAPADDAATLRAEITSLEGEDTERFEAWVATASAGSDPGAVPVPANLTKLQALRTKLIAAEHHERLVTRARHSLQEKRNALAVQGEAAGEMIRASIRHSLVSQANDIVADIEATIRALAGKLGEVGGLRAFLQHEGD